MAPTTHDRTYDIALVGATGYTGRLTAMAIAEQLPTNLRWAIVGRSTVKLENLAKKLKDAFPDRLQPDVVAMSLDQLDQVASVAQKTKVCISTVHYHSVGNVVVQACAENGADYIDCTGNYPEVGRWIRDHHETAKENGAAIIVGAGHFSAPQDLLAWSAVGELAKHASIKTREVIVTFPNEAALDASGGTMDSIGSKLLADPAEAAESQQPWFLSPVAGSTDITNSVGLLGTRRDAHLGLLCATAFGAVQDRAFVHRSWGLLGGAEGYGPEFRFNEYETAASTLAAVAKLLKAKALGALLSSSFVFRYVLRPLFPAAGEGPDEETERQGRSEMHAVAIGDKKDNGGAETPKAFASFRFPGGPYRCTAVLLAQGAASLLFTRQLGGGHKGGILTPAILGQDYIDRMVSVGTEFETKML